GRALPERISTRSSALISPSQGLFQLFASKRDTSGLTRWPERRNELSIELQKHGAGLARKNFEAIVGLEGTRLAGIELAGENCIPVSHNRHVAGLGRLDFAPQGLLFLR